MSKGKGCRRASFFYVFHHADFNVIIMIVKENFKFFHTEITKFFNLFVTHNFATGSSDQRVV
uniref:Uncharacterized protein n=4 Tax=Enterobacteriaceae TaxID=543 RepID=A0A2R4PES0_ECOLX|nr:hypothetical protein [Enterobacter cloacae]AKL79973.1 hypothetical protein [Klebsiella pneumoniae subsp. pneumoniae]AVX50168.1 hypothetical protein [Escherichia coli]AWF76897.1 hypothetical protein [Klebsiella pneumoniae]UUW42311.1 hypothetical protein [Klebsiella michiganensis]UUW42574.1 hypothetical protein [Citrobacter portucalensis]